MGPPDLPVGPVGVDEARHAVERVLARPEFDRLEPTLLERIQHWIVDRLSELWSTLAGTGGTSPLGTVLLVALVAGLVYAIVRGARRVQRPVRHGDGTGEAAAPVVPTEVDWLADAQRHEEAGEWTDAVRCRYRAMVQGLVERGVVDDVAGRTPREHRSEAVAARPDLARPVTVVSETFERAWYGHRAVAADDAADVARAADVVAAGSRP